MVPLERVHDIIKEWKRYCTDIHRFHDPHSDDHYEENRIPILFRELALFLLTHEPILREWMMGYIERHRDEIMHRWWTNHLTEWAQDRMERFPKKRLHPRSKDECLIQTARFQEEVMKLSAIRDISHCDIPEIRAIHKDKGCDDWLCCFLCEEAEEEWRRELKKRMQNVLSSLSIHELPHKEWTPPYSYRNEVGEYVNRTDYKLYLCERRILSYKSNQTTREMITSLISETMYYSAWTLPHWKIADEYDLFLLLWNTLDIIRASIRMDLYQVQQIEEKRKKMM